MCDVYLLDLWQGQRSLMISQTSNDWKTVKFHTGFGFELETGTTYFRLRVIPTSSPITVCVKLFLSRHQLGNL